MSTTEKPQGIADRILLETRQTRQTSERLLPLLGLLGEDQTTGSDSSGAELMMTLLTSLVTGIEKLDERLEMIWAKLDERSLRALRLQPLD